MDTDNRKNWLYIGIVGIVLVGMLWYLFFYTRNSNTSSSRLYPTRIPPTVTPVPNSNSTNTIDKDFWRTDTVNLTAGELQIIKALLLAHFSQLPQGNRIIVSTVRAENGWGDLAVSQIDTKGIKVSGEPAYVVIYKEKAEWKLIYPSDPQFCNKLKQGPSDLFATTIEYFCPK